MIDKAQQLKHHLNMVSIS